MMYTLAPILFEHKVNYNSLSLLDKSTARYRWTVQCTESIKRSFRDASVLLWGQIKTRWLYLSVTNPPMFWINNTDAISYCLLLPNDCTKCASKVLLMLLQSTVYCRVVYTSLYKRTTDKQNDVRLENYFENKILSEITTSTNMFVYNWFSSYKELNCVH